MRTPPILTAAATMLVLGSCTRPAPPAPPPRPVAPPPVTRPAPAPPPPATADWRDWPAAPGDWRIAGAVASFGPAGAPALTLACEGGRVRLSRPAAAGVLTVRTSTGLRALPEATLAASDPLLDAMGFSRGRFVVEAAGAPPLVVPAWAELLRLIEDCRD